MRCRPLVVRLFGVFALLVSALVGPGCIGCEELCEPRCVGTDICVAGACVPDVSLPCAGLCGTDAECIGEVCVPTFPQCAAAGDNCRADQLVTEDFFCLDLDGVLATPGVCVDFCADDGSCAPGGLCFFVATGLDAECSTDDDCPDHTACQDGACRNLICRPSECEGPYIGDDTCFAIYGAQPEGSRCAGVGNDASYCFPGGGRSQGESCVDFTSAIVANNFADACGVGLGCVGGVCRRACTADDETVCTDNNAGDACLSAGEDLLAPGVGVCGFACTPFSMGECAAGLKCEPLSRTEGTCVAAGPRELNEVCEAGIDECVEGLVCVSFGAGGLPIDGAVSVGRCLPMCNIFAGEPNEDGIVGPFAQSQRDATCPQADTPTNAYVRFTLLASGEGPVDIYLDDALIVAGLVAGETTDADTAAAGPQWHVVDAGVHEANVLPAGAPSTDPPLVTVSLTPDVDSMTRVLLLPVPQATGTLNADTSGEVRTLPVPTPPNATIRFANYIPGAGALDFVAVPPGDDLSVPSNQVELTLGLGVASESLHTQVAAGSVDVLGFPAGAARPDRGAAVFEANALTIAEGAVATLFVFGTSDPADFEPIAASLLDDVAVPPLEASTTVYRCVDPGADSFGYCQQSCGADADGYSQQVCIADDQGCAPTFNAATRDWENLCAPLGPTGVGEGCDPFAQAGDSGCAEGLHCLEFGNSVDDGDLSGLRGRCQPLCVIDEPAHPTLQCDAGQGCAEIAFDDEFRIGQCGFPCTPDASLVDSACPAGLQNCKPVASLKDDLSGQGDVPPLVSDEPTFCSASGDIAVGDPCSGSDCVAGSECLFPRSEQLDFVSGLLSHYFGGDGLVPVCTPFCDPFDGPAGQCGAGETCLFNFPFSADVGACATIRETRIPFDGCEFPGEACGENAICVVDGGAPVCLHFCEYVGEAPGGGGLAQSTCPNGTLCNPLVNDIGFCN